MKYNAILFDFDGTLTESGLGITRSAAYACEKMGVPVPAQEILDRFIGPPLVASFRQYGGMSEAEAMQATEFYRERYRETGWRENKVYPGIAPLLRDLKENGCYLAIASAKPEVFVRQISEYFGIARYFDRIVGITFETTHADKSHLIARALPENVGAYRCAMVGDRLYDMEAAKKCGLSAIGALYGYGSRDELETAGADSIAESVSALRAILLPNAAPKPGRFITFEGADPSVKRTQLRLLDEYLTSRGYETLVCPEDGGCAVSQRICRLATSIGRAEMTAACEALLFAASRAEDMRRTILPALKEGKIVLCEQFSGTSFAYRAQGCELNDDFIRQIDAPAMKAVPDRSYCFVEGDGAIPARPHGEADSYCADFCKRLLRACDETRADPSRVQPINSGRSAEAVFEDVRADVNALID